MDHGSGPSFALAALAFLAVQGCSFDRPSQGIEIRLQSSSDLLTASLNELATSEVRAITDLNCFGVNVHGSTISSLSICSGLEAGVIDGPYQGISSTFAPVVPVGDGLIFEAFASSNSTCKTPGIDADAGAFFRIGRVAFNVGEGSNIVTIPVAFDSSSTFSCSNGPYTVYTDAFSYSSGVLSSSLSGGNWLDSPSTAHTISNSELSYTGAPPTRINSLNRTIDASKAYTRYSLDVTFSSALPGVVKLGQVIDNSASPSSGVLCVLSFNTSSGAATLTVEDAVATSPVTSSTTLATGTMSVRFTCEIQTVGSTVTARASISGTHTMTPAVGTIVGSPAGARPTIRQAGGSTTSIFDNFQVEQAAATQF